MQGKLNFDMSPEAFDQKGTVLHTLTGGSEELQVAIRMPAMSA